MTILLFRFPVLLFSRFLILAVTVTLLISQASAQVVEIPDPNLEKAIREELQLSEGTPITQQEMLRLERLSAWDSEIADLTGLEHATSLMDLGLLRESEYMIYVHSLDWFN